MATYLLFGVIGFSLFVAAFPASSYRYYLLGAQKYHETRYIGDYAIWKPIGKSEISYDEYKYQLREDNLKNIRRLIRQLFPYAVGASIFLILLFTDPLRKRFEITKEEE